MMAKCQQMDVYIKPRTNEQLPGFPHNYDPNGWNLLEEDALVLREIWNQLKDYPNLEFVGNVNAGPGEEHYVLSSAVEALVYVSSGVGDQDISYDANRLNLRGLALQDGLYTASIVDPVRETLSTEQVVVGNGRVDVETPAFVDDLAVHLVAGEAAIAQSRQRTASTEIDSASRYSGLSVLLGIAGVLVLCVTPPLLTQQYINKI